MENIIRWVLVDAAQYSVLGAPLNYLIVGFFVFAGVIQCFTWVIDIFLGVIWFYRHIDNIVWRHNWRRRYRRRNV